MVASTGPVARGRLHGQVAVVTGGGSGIGRAVVDRFIAEGACVTVLDRDADRVQDLASVHGAQVLCVGGDVRDPSVHEETVLRTLRTFGRLDTYVANAGIYDYSARFDDMSTEELRRGFAELFGTNVLGSLQGIRAAVPALRRQRGSVIITASSSSSYAGGGGVLYVASKHALVGVMRQLAFELAPEIRVNAIAPGATVTNLSGLSVFDQQDTRLQGVPGFEERTARSLPLGFVSTPEDHAGLYVLLADAADSRFITGVTLSSDGGLAVRGGGRRPDNPVKERT